MPCRELFVDCDDHQLACLAHENPEATEPPIVWVHGLTMSVRFWEKGMFESVVAHRSWYSVSLPLHHPSTFSRPLTAETLNEDLFAEMLRVAVDALVPETEATRKVHLVGHSLGGFAALNYAAKHPDRVASVVSIGGFMTGRARGLEGALQFLSKERFGRKALFHLAYRILRSHYLFLKIAGVSYGRRFRTLLRSETVEATLRHVYPDVCRHPVDAQRAFCAFLLDMDLFDEIEQIHQPVLFIVGDRDPIISPVHQIDCARRLPQGELRLYEKVGHLAFAEVPERFERDLVEWLERHDREMTETAPSA